MDLYSVLIFCTLFLIQILGLYVFVRYAHRLGLSDKPNLRSSHDYAVVRGGGVIFGLSWLAGCLIQGTAFTVFNLGLILLMVIGLWDDIRGLSSFVRLIVQFFSVFLLALHFDFIVVFGLLWTGLLILLFTYLINVFNFMDGINGILGLYALTVLALLFHDGFALDGHSFPFVFLVFSLFSFLFYNLRSKAKVFSGDVGSLSISYLLIGGLVNMLLQDRTYVTGFQFMLLFLLPVSIFFMDSFTTILHRLWIRENIFQSHRFHLYQIITPGIIKSQLSVSIAYALFQMVLTFLFLNLTNSLFLTLYFLLLLTIFFLLRFVLLRK